MPRHRLRIPDLSVVSAVERPTIWSDDDPRDALQAGDFVTANGVRYLVADVEIQRDRDGGLRTGSYLVEGA
jgi:hypothetical protein